MEGEGGHGGAVRVGEDGEGRTVGFRGRDDGETGGCLARACSRGGVGILQEGGGLVALCRVEGIETVDDDELGAPSQRSAVTLSSTAR